MDISAVVPVYNSSGTLPELAQRLHETLSGLGKSFELIFIDDGSNDSSWSALEAARSRYPQHVRIAQLMRNFGQHNATMCGLRMAEGEIVLTIDDDLEQPPEEIPALLDTLEKGDYDLAYAYWEDSNTGAIRALGRRAIISFYRKAFGSAVASLSSFRAIRRQLMDSILTFDSSFAYIDGLLAWNTTRVGGLKIDRAARRPQSKSNYSALKLFNLAMDVFAGFSLWPLRIASLAGLASIAVSVLATVILALSCLLGACTSLFALAAIACLALGGAQLLSIGLLGEYVGRMHLNACRKPQYSVRRVADREREGSARA